MSGATRSPSQPTRTPSKQSNQPKPHIHAKAHNQRHVKALPLGEATLGPRADSRMVNVLNVDCSNAKTVFETLAGQSSMDGTLSGYEVQVADVRTGQWISKRRDTCVPRGSFQECHEYLIAASNGVFRIQLARTSPAMVGWFSAAMAMLATFLVFIVLAMLTKSKS